MTRQFLIAVAAVVVAAVSIGIVAGHDGGKRTRPAPAITVPPTGELWLDTEKLAALPRDTAAWHSIVQTGSVARTGAPDLNVRSDRHSAVLANALIAMRDQDQDLRRRVRDALDETVRATSRVVDDLALARQLVTVVLTADLIRLPDLDPEFDGRFRAWLDRIRVSLSSTGRTLVSTHEVRPNNWGTHAGASRIAADLYLGDLADLDRAAMVFAGWLGDRSAYAGFKYGSDLSWQCNPSRPVGVNPAGCTIDGHPMGGALPEEMRRSGSFTWPPPQENYAWGGLQGAVVQAELLSRAGYDAWNWSDQALERALDWLHDQAGFPAEGDDTWIPWLVNDATGRSFPTVSPTRPGKNLGYTDWTHAS